MAMIPEYDQWPSCSSYSETDSKAGERPLTLKEMQRLLGCHKANVAQEPYRSATNLSGRKHKLRD